MSAPPTTTVDQAPTPTTEPQPVGSGITATSSPPLDPLDVELPVTGAGVELTIAVAVVAILSGLGLRKAAR